MVISSNAVTAMTQAHNNHNWSGKVQEWTQVEAATSMGMHRPTVPPSPEAARLGVQWSQTVRGISEIGEGASGLRESPHA